MATIYVFSAARMQEKIDSQVSSLHSKLVIYKLKKWWIGQGVLSMGAPVLMVLISMVSIQMGATVAKSLFLTIGAAGTTVMRLALASCILLTLWPPQRRKIKARTLFLIARYGGALGCMNLCFYLALERIPLGIAVALEFTGPLTVALFASRKASDFLWAFLAIAGVFLLIPFSPVSPRTLDPIGLELALAAAFFWAMYIVFGQKIENSVDEKRATAIGMAFGTIIVLPVAAIYSDLSLISLKIIPLAIAVALLSSALPYPLELMALQRIPARTFGILMSLEPVIAAIFGLLFLRESLTQVQWLAISCIIVASLGSAFSSRRDQKSKTKAKLMLSERSCSKVMP